MLHLFLFPLTKEKSLKLELLHHLRNKHDSCYRMNDMLRYYCWSYKLKQMMVMIVYRHACMLCFFSSCNVGSMDRKTHNSCDFSTMICINIGPLCLWHTIMGSAFSSVKCYSLKCNAMFYIVFLFSL